MYFAKNANPLHVKIYMHSKYVCTEKTLIRDKCPQFDQPDASEQLMGDACSEGVREAPKSRYNKSSDAQQRIISCYWRMIGVT